MNIEIDNFSAGAWRMKVKLEPFSGDRVELSIEDIHPFLKATKTKPPLLIRLNRTFLPVYSGQSIPYKVLAIPEDVEEALKIDLPTEKYILVVKQQEQLKKILMNDEEFGGFKIP